MFENYNINIENQYERRTGPPYPPTKSFSVHIILVHGSNKINQNIDNTDSIPT